MKAAWESLKMVATWAAVLVLAGVSSHMAWSLFCLGWRAVAK